MEKMLHIYFLTNFFNLCILLIYLHPHTLFSCSGHVFGVLCFGERTSANVLTCSFGATIQEKAP